MSKIKDMIDEALWPYKNWDKLDGRDKARAIGMATIWVVIPVSWIVAISIKLAQ